MNNIHFNSFKPKIEIPTKKFKEIYKKMQILKQDLYKKKLFKLKEIQHKFKLSPPAVKPFKHEKLAQCFVQRPSANCLLRRPSAHCILPSSRSDHWSLTE